MTSVSLRTFARTEAMLDAFAADVGTQPLGGALVRETVLVARSTAMRAYVEAGLARALGCAASIDLQAPRLFVAEMARRFGLVPPAPGGRAYEATSLGWRIAALLPGLDGPVFAPLHAYLDRQAETGRPGGVFALASRIAAAFDDYQVYRPDVLAAWQAGRLAGTHNPHEAWQARLWQTLCEEELPTADPDAPAELDRASTIRELTRRLSERLYPAEAATLPPRVSVVGVPLMPPTYLGVLAALARNVPVTVYAVVAGIDGGRGWGESQRHPLLQSLGGHTADAARLFAGLGLPAPIHTPAIALSRRAAVSALHAVQAAVLADAPPDHAVRLDPDDRSIRVLDAHSPLREVEALRDELYDAFDAIPDLRPSDVAVLVPDLATYAPLVEAVFRTRPPDVDGRRSGRPPLLPIHIADAPRGPERHVLDAFTRLLGLLDGRTTASDVLGLLDVPAVRRAASIDESELATVHAWVRQMRIHWGRDGAHKAEHEPADASTPDDALPDGDLNTWRFGLDRLLLGVMTGPTEATVLGRRPAGEGTLDAANLLGRLAEWTTALFRSLETLRAPRPLAAWADALLLFVDGLLVPDDAAELEAVVALRSAADRLTTLRPPRDVEPDVSLVEVQAHLAQALATLDLDEPYLTGKVTIVDPTAARLVPFRVLAVVGLGDAFPRSESRPAFDLLATDAATGDPDPAGTDRQTFLDAVLSARDRLVLTFTGRSQRDGSERAASAALDALLDTCAATFGADAERLVVRHRLQPFSPAYAEEGTGLFSYTAPRRRRRDASAGDPFFEPPHTDTDAPLLDGQVTTTIDRLAAAWMHPVRAYCEARNLKPDLAEIDLADEAPAELDSLTFYSVKERLLALLTAGVPPDDAYDILRGTGVLPPGALGRAWFDKAYALVADVAKRASAHGPAVSTAVDAETEKWRVEGILAVGPGGGLRVRASTVGGKDLVRGWVDHLALCAQEPGGDGVAGRRTTVVGQDKTVSFDPLDAPTARAVLQGLVRGMQAFEHVPVPLFEHASYAYAQEMWKSRRPEMVRSADNLLRAEGGPWRPVRVGQTFAEARGGLTPHEPAFAAARKAYVGAFGAIRADATDPYVALCYRHRAPVDAFPDAVDRWARILWAPLLRGLRDA